MASSGLWENIMFTKNILTIDDTTLCLTDTGVYLSDRHWYQLHNLKLKLRNIFTSNTVVLPLSSSGSEANNLKCE